MQPVPSTGVAIEGTIQFKKAVNQNPLCDLLINRARETQNQTEL